MSDIEQLASGITDMQSGWDTFRQLVTPDGVRLEEAWAAWAEEQKQRLASPGARTEFVELCQAGCVPEILALTRAVVRFGTWISELWQETLGRTDKRQKLTLSLERAAKALEDYYAEWAVPENAKTPKDDTKIKRDWPLSLIAEIRSHNDMWIFFGRLADKFDVNSIAELTKYLLVAYVKGATGRFRDTSVSALLGEILGPLDYNEVAQRMWRSRNYKRLEQSLFMLSDLLL